MESSFLRQKQVKTYGNPRKNASNSLLKSNYVNSNVILIKRVALTTKKAVELMLSGNLKSKVCRYCLYLTYPLSELDQIMQIAGHGALYKVTIRDIVASVHPFKVVNDPNFPNKICEKCLNQAIQAYLFAQQCEQSERALRNCFEDVYERFDKLDPLEKPKKRGRQKLRQNHNIIKVQHRKVIDYAEPIRNLINVSSVSLTNEPQIGPLECRKCWQVLPNIESLANHEQIHPKSMWYHCRLCGKAYAKKYQMNRHVNLHVKGKLTNSLEIAENKQDTEFVCKHCGDVSENYDVHLQHSEKHNFKMLMEHLVQNKMDKLCAVCLNKKGNMVQMDKMISLHGGYPELTGDRTLYNILGSTLPEPNYKYQELRISQKATIMMIARKVKKNVLTTGFNLSLPLIISAENDNYVESYLFLFSAPEHLQENEINTMKNYDHDVDIYSDEPEPAVTHMPNTYFENSDVDVISIPVEKQIENIEETINESKDVTEQYIFSKPNYKIDIEEFAKPKKKEIKHNHTLCNMCWIFNKPTCKKCIEDNIEKSSNDCESIVQNEDNTPDTEAKPCQYCWVFKHVDKCEYCKRNQNVIVTAKNSDDESTAGNDGCNVKSTTTKRKFNSANAVTTKKSKWQCNICLVTNNFDRETCICCESQEKYHGAVNVNFGANKNKFLDFMTINPKLKELSDCKVDNNDIKTTETQNVNMNEVVSNLTTVDIIEQPVTEMMELSNTPDSNILPEFIELMDIANEGEESSVNIMPTLQESPMFEAPSIPIQGNTLLSTPPSYPFSFKITPTVSPFVQPVDIPTFPKVQFNIGSQGGPRKYKKPLRRMATSSHK